MNLLAVDVGHGHVKIVHRAPGPVIRQLSFPSYAIPTTAQGVKHNSVSQAFQVMTTEVEGSHYLVGNGIAGYTSPSDQRNRDENYSMSAPYLALMRGAFATAGMDVIDLLVVGLPLSTLNSNEDRLAERLRGTHPVPAFEVQGTVKNQVTVKRVEVLAQPVGALLSAIRKDPSLQSERILTFDLGFHTLDVLTSFGINPLPSRAGAVQGGVAGFIDEIQKSVEEEVRERNPRINGQYRVPPDLYESALQSPAPRTIKLSVGKINIEPHFQRALKRLELDVAKAISMIGSVADISTFILAGGGAELLRPILEKNHPAITTINSLEDPQFAIARGYLAYGEMVSRVVTSRG